MGLTMNFKLLPAFLAGSLALTGCLDIDSKRDSRSPLLPESPLDNPPGEPEPDPVPLGPLTATPFAQGQNLASYHVYDDPFFYSIDKFLRRIDGNTLHKEEFSRSSEAGGYDLRDASNDKSYHVYSGGLFSKEIFDQRQLDTANYELSWTTPAVQFDIFHDEIDLTSATVRSVFLDNGYSVSDSEAFDETTVFTSGAEAYLESLTVSEDFVTYAHRDDEGNPCNYPYSQTGGSDADGNCNIVLVGDPGSAAPATTLASLIGADLGSAPSIIEFLSLGNDDNYKFVETETGQGDIYKYARSGDVKVGAWLMGTLDDGLEYIAITEGAPTRLGVLSESRIPYISDDASNNHYTNALFVAKGFVRPGTVIQQGETLMSDKLVFNDTAALDVESAVVWPEDEGGGGCCAF